MTITLKTITHDPTQTSLALDIAKQSTPSAEQLVDDVIRDQITQIESQSCTIGYDDPFFVENVGELQRQYDRWVSHLPNIRPFYGKLTTNLMYIHSNGLIYLDSHEMQSR